MNVFRVITSTAFLFSIIRVTTPLLYGSLSSLMSELSGVSNIGIEGMMLTCALTGVLSSAFFGANAGIGLLCAVLVGIVLGLLLCFLITKLQTDAIITGIAYNLTASGLTVFLLYLAVGEKGISSSLVSGVLPSVEIPLLNKIPFVGEVLSGHNILTYVAILLVILISVFLYKTPLGLHIRGCGESPEALESVGIHVSRVQYIALAFSGALAALGGAYMSMGYVSYFVKDMIAGRGFIAIAAASLGANRPLPTLLVCLLFGAAEALAVNPSIQNMGVPTELVSTIPYIVTIIVLVIYSCKKMNDRKRAAAA